jgi:mono/diheme cytochrome c family protein
MITIAEPIDLDTLRIRHELISMPDLRVSVDPIAALLQITPRHALLALETPTRNRRVAENPAVTASRLRFFRNFLRQHACYSRVQEGMTMRSALLTATLCLGLAAAAAAQDAKVAKGQQLFTDQKCTLCHSIGDKGNKKGPLDGVASKLSADEIRAWITDAKGMTAKTKATRKPEMKAFALPKDDVDALVAYLATLKK